MGEKIPGYLITGELHQSIRSIIYRGIRQSDQQPVILKVLNQAYPSPEEISHFKYEYELTKSLDIPGVPKVHALKKFGNNLAMVMEDFGGVSLRNYLSEHVPFSLFFSIVKKINKVIEDIHRYNIIHKDINPQNILWNPQTEELNIIDFGISTELSREKQNIDLNNLLEGSLAYISPEQTGRMNREVDYRTDYYSFGITMYELLTGRLPFHSEDSMGWLHSHISKTPPNPRVIRNEIPEILAEIPLKMMAKNAEDRYQSSRGLMLDLEECEKQWRGKGKIEAFPLGKHDISKKFHISQKIYGRENEVATVVNAFEGACKGSSEVIIVTGYSGVGKSTLIYEVQKNIVDKNAYFLEGKFDQFKQKSPYSAIIQALQSLIRQLLSETNKQLQAWREKLQTALGQDCQIMINLVPELEQIIGEEVEPQPISQPEIQNRFLVAIIHFISTFTESGHPLVIFLDDLQWSDKSSLQLIQNLVIATEIQGLLLIGVYRNNQVEEDHPLITFLDRIQKSKPIRRLFLKSLGITTVSQIVADTLHCDLERSQPLAELIHQKTEGNPFFVKELLKNLYYEHKLKYVDSEGRWNWDLENIRSVGVSENVVQFMIARLRKLPFATQQILQLAACIGYTFDLQTLSNLYQKEKIETAKLLWEGIQLGIIVPLNDQYKFVRTKEKNDKSDKSFGVVYKFQHDRVQQAAYSLIEEEKRRKFHLEIGRLLVLNTESKDREKKSIEIVRQLNEGVNLIDDLKERRELAQLNLMAGKKSKSSTAYHQALEYLSIGMNLLAENAWEEEYELAFSMTVELSECAYLSGEFHLAEEYNELLLENVKSREEKVEILRKQLIQLTIVGKLEKTTVVGIQGLKHLDIHFPETPSNYSVRKEACQVRKNMAKHNFTDLEALPLISNSDVAYSLKMLMELASSSFVSSHPQLLALTILRMINLTLDYGVCPESSFAFAGYGVLQGSMFQNLKLGYDYGQLALSMADKFQDQEIRCRVYLIYSFLIHHWSHHWKTLDSYFKKTIETGYLSGDLLHLAFACSQVTKWNPDLNLDSSIEEGKRYISIIEEVKYQDGLDLAMLYQQLRLNLSGSTHNPFSLSNDHFDEAECLSRMEEHKFYPGIATYYLCKLQVNYFYGDYNACLNQIQKVENIAFSLTGTPGEVEFSFYIFLTFSALYNQFSTEEKKKAGLRMREEHRKMKRWSDHCPVNFFHLWLIMEAERMRLSKNFMDASHLYDQAIETSQENGFIHYEGIASELAMKMYLQQKRDKIASVFLADARYYYYRWGAKGKVQQLEETYPRLLEKNKSMDRLFSSSDNTSSPTPSANPGVAQKERSVLDLAVVAKASQTLSSEMVLEKLLKKLMGILLESAGAEKGVLLLLDEATKRLHAEAASLNGEPVEVDRSERIENNTTLCITIVQYVMRSQDTVVIGDAVRQGNYTQDNYVKKNLPKSILCTPIHNHGKLVGVLYLENNVATYAFTSEHLEILRILSSQAAISIVNAQLYSDLELRVLKRTQELKTAKEKAEETNRRLTDLYHQMHEELEQAKITQLALLPRVLPEIQDCEVAAKFESMTHIGGDFYDVIELSEDSVGIFLADVTGHGVPAALISSMVSSLFRTFAPKYPQVTRLICALNDGLCANIPDGRFSTGIYCIYHMKSKMLHYSVAGHPPGYIIRTTTKELIPLDQASAMMLGVFPSDEFGFQEDSIQLIPGDKVFLYTDGIYEMSNSTGEQFGFKRLEEFLIENRHLPVKKLLDSIYQHVLEYSRASAYDDDVTFFGMEILR